MTGNPVVAFHAKTTAGDTDFFARLIDVAPDGAAVDVSMGLVRAKYRHGRTQPPDRIVPNRLVRYEIRLRPVSNAFLPGHRIRLDITSSDFPNYNRNHNIAGNPNFDPTFVVAKTPCSTAPTTPPSCDCPSSPPQQNEATGADSDSDSDSDGEGWCYSKHQSRLESWGFLSQLV